ncbi:MAG TPA: nickel insertion protein, partial [Gemmatimonadales bacterium]|nr:nickel insertion protein [Gemmatimonadales bacterium]
MPDGRFAILDPVAGISGDMLLGALLSAGASPDWLRALPSRLGYPEVRIDIQIVDRCGVSATKVNVVLPGEVQELPSPSYEHHDHGPGNGHQHVHPHHHGASHSDADRHAPHRHIGELISLIEEADLSPWVRERAVRAF